MIRAGSCYTCYDGLHVHVHVCKILPRYKGWHCMSLKELTHEVTSLLRVWKARVEVTQNVKTAFLKYTC